MKESYKAMEVFPLLCWGGGGSYSQDLLSWIGSRSHRPSPWTRFQRLWLLSQIQCFASAHGVRLERFGSGPGSELSLRLRLVRHEATVAAAAAVYGLESEDQSGSCGV